MQATEETNELRRVNRDALETALVRRSLAGHQSLLADACESQDSLFTYKEHIVEQVGKLNQLADEHLVSF